MKPIRFTGEAHMAVTMGTTEGLIFLESLHAFRRQYSPSILYVHALILLCVVRCITNPTYATPFGHSSAKGRLGLGE